MTIAVQFLLTLGALIGFAAYTAWIFYCGYRAGQESPPTRPRV